MSYNFEEITTQVKKKVSEKRFIHTLGVSYTAAALAMCYGADMEDARAAGLLHDYAKAFSDEKLLEKCIKHHLPVSSSEKKSPYLLHGKVAAYYAQKKFGIKNQQVLDAITYHTTGREDMSLLEKIIFVADFIEPNRKPLKNLPVIRKAAFENIDQSVYMILSDTLSYLGQKNDKEIDPVSQSAFCYYDQLVHAK